VEPVPPALLADFERARVIGFAIYAQDQASSRATDVMLREKVLPGDGRVRGWVTLPRDQGWLVRFVRTDGAPTTTHAVSIDRNGETALEALETEEALQDEALHRFRARTTALRARFSACSSSYNPVVLPASALGREGWLVYLLAASADPKEIISGGHHRFHVSADGTRVLEQMAMSKGCMTQRLASDAGAEVSGIWLVTPIADHPLETHFFTSLQYGLSFGIGTARNGRMWNLDGAALRSELARLPITQLPR
jgi:hypothetical protein